VRTLALIAAAAILVLQLLAVHGLAGRPLHYDENEYMHASWLMAAGKHIYRDFFEDHPPHLALMLHGVLPRVDQQTDLLQTDVRQWTIHARQVSGAFGAIAVGAVMLFAWRMTRAPAAPIVVAATLLASSQIWARGLADIRAEAPTLALFWVGVVLLTWSAEATLAHIEAKAGTEFDPELVRNFSGMMRKFEGRVAVVDDETSVLTGAAAEPAEPAKSGE
jgi:hypothetical protein